MVRLMRSFGGTRVQARLRIDQIISCDRNDRLSRVHE